MMTIRKSSVRLILTLSKSNTSDSTYYYSKMMELFEIEYLYLSLYRECRSKILQTILTRGAYYAVSLYKKISLNSLHFRISNSKRFPSDQR